MDDLVKIFLILDARRNGALQRFIEDHRAARHDVVSRSLRELFQVTFDLPVQALPDLGPLQDDEDEPKPEPNAVVALDWMPREQALDLERRIAAEQERLNGITISADLALAPADIWCPNQATSSLFGMVDNALALICFDALPSGGQADGTDVRVIIIDQGIDRDYLSTPGGPFVTADGKARGWSVIPGGVPPQPTRNPGSAEFGHGTLMALLVNRLAPEAKIYDLPLLPERIHDQPVFLSLAATAMLKLRNRVQSNVNRRWVLCNAWSVYNLDQDIPLPSVSNYGQNPNNAFTALVRQIAQNNVGAGGADVVFAAGNCGQYCPDGRCGSGQVGPGSSIYGVAALAEVMTVGAVRNDMIWLGYSSQGPSPAAFGSQKPDLCAPSQFGEPLNASIGYSGTSAACGVSAGVVAALRDTAFPWVAATVPAPQTSPAQMIKGLRQQARPVSGQSLPDDLRLGAGILDLCKFVTAFAVQPQASLDRSGADQDGFEDERSRPGFNTLGRFIAGIRRLIFRS
jgi:Subtilase family